jgi:hypothetical protein
MITLCSFHCSFQYFFRLDFQNFVLSPPDSLNNRCQNDQVSVSPTFYEQLFCTEVFLCSYSQITFWLCNFLQKNIWKKLLLICWLNGLQFIVTGANSPIPTLCGQNSGQHGKIFTLRGHPLMMSRRGFRESGQGCCDISLSTENCDDGMKMGKILQNFVITIIYGHFIKSELWFQFKGMFRNVVIR